MLHQMNCEKEGVLGSRNLTMNRVMFIGLIEEIATHITKYPRKAVWILIASTSSVDLPANRVFMAALPLTAAVWTTEGTGSLKSMEVATLATWWWLFWLSILVNLTCSGGGTGGALSVPELDSEVSNFCFPNHFFFDLLDFCNNKKNS